MWVHSLVTFPREKEKAKVTFFDLVGFLCVVALKNEEAILSKAAK